MWENFTRAFKLLQDAAGGIPFLYTATRRHRSPPLPPARMLYVYVTVRKWLLNQTRNRSEKSGS